VRTLFSSHISKAKHFHTEASQLPLPPIIEGMKIARSAGVRVIFDLDVAPTYFAQARLGSEDELIAALQLVDVLKPCKAAAREITGESSYEKMASKLLALGPKLVALTMGADGCLIAAANQMVRVPPFQVKVVDSTGAGDAFMGGLSYGLLQGWDHQRVGVFANACAAICCTKVGARSMGRLDDVMALIKSQRSAEASAYSK
jgi:sugar/nucleoside kinase (ribokinase family)